MTRLLPATTLFLVVALGSSCKKEGSSEHQADGNGTLPDKIYELIETNQVVNGLLHSDTAWVTAFSYDDRDRVTSMEKAGLKGDSNVGVQIVHRFFYRSGNPRPWLITRQISRNGIGIASLDSSFYRYTNDHIAFDSTISQPGYSYVKSFVPNTNGYHLNTVYHIPSGLFNPLEWNASVKYSNGNLSESVISETPFTYGYYLTATYLNAPNPFFRIIPAYPVHAPELLGAFDFNGQPNLVSMENSDEDQDDQYAVRYSYEQRSDGYPTKMTISAYQESPQVFLYTYK